MSGLASGRAHVNGRVRREDGRGHHLLSPVIGRAVIRWHMPGGMPIVLTSGASTAGLGAGPWRAVRFRILGPLEIEGWCGRVELRRQKQKALLIALLLRAGEVVSLDQLIEDLWGESSPRHALGSLQNLVSELRKGLGPGLLRTRAPGYLLEVDPHLVDAHRFVRLVDSARAAERAAERAEVLRAALSLWRGRALVDVAFEPFADGAAARLESARHDAWEELIDAELELGRHHAVVAEVESLVAEQPFRERPRRQLMLALYRAGRQADALAAFREARKLLREELGLEPSPTLRSLHKAILRQSPALDLPAPGGGALVASFERRVSGLDNGHMHNLDPSAHERAVTGQTEMIAIDAAP